MGSIIPDPTRQQREGTLPVFDRVQYNYNVLKISSYQQKVVSMLFNFYK